jgi:hypothetical protein
MKTKAKSILHDHNDDGLDRRGFLEMHGLGRHGNALDDPRRKSTNALRRARRQK